MESDTSKTSRRILVSIIIPVFNREKTLPRLFRSIFRITYTPLEIILIDNGSSDQSKILCENFQVKAKDRDGFDVYLAQELKPGACPCRNLGMRLSHGEFLFFFDSDDEISPDFITELIPYCSAYDAICAPTNMHFDNGKTKVRACLPTDQPYDQILSASISTQSLLVRKSFIQNIGGWDEKLKRWNDWELGVRLLCNHPRLKWLPQKSYHTIYQHAESISGKSFSQDYENLKKSIRKAECDLSKSLLSPTVYKKSLNALSSKCLLFSSELYKEGNKKAATSAYYLSKKYASTCKFRLFSPLVYFLAKHKVPGTWRLFRWLI